MSSTFRTRGLGLPLTTAALLLLGVRPLSAATFNVAPGDVAGLIAAINTANGNGLDDTIDLGGGTFTLTASAVDVTGATGLPSVQFDLGRSLTIRNGTIERAVAAPPFRILAVELGRLVLENVTLRGGSTPAPGFGGAIFTIGGTVTIVGSTLSGNAAFLEGGAIHSDGTLSIVDSTLSNNVAGVSGGALLNNGTLSVSGSTLSGNTASTDGGAILNQAGATLSAAGSTFSGNAATSLGGAIANGGTVAAIRNCTFSGNSAWVGGGLENHGTVSAITNSTFAQNATSYQGGGIANAQGATISLLESCIVATNTGLDGPPDLFNGGTLASASNDLVGDGAGSGLTNGVSGNLVGTFASPVDPLLGTLANNGGPTFTHALLAGSPATDAGSNPAALANDQRGLPYLRTSGTRTDIGAFELQAVADLSVTKTDGVTSVNAGGSTTYTIVAANAGPSAATGAVFTDTLPASLTCTYTSVAAGGATGNPASGSGSISSTLSLPPGASVTYTVACAVPATAFGTISNTATIAVPAGVTDPNLANDSATDTDAVVTGARVSGTKSVSGTYAVGGTVTYTIVLSNGGIGPQVDAPGDELVDLLPATLALVSATATAGTAAGDTVANTVRWNGPLGAGSSVTVTIMARVLASAAGQTVSNQGTISFDGNGDGTNDSSTLTDDPGLPGTTDPTVFAVPGQATVVVPTLGPFGLLLMAALVAAAGLAVRWR